jgi:type II secretory pathway component PulL
MSNFLFIRIESDQDLSSQQIAWVLVNNLGKIEQLSEKSDSITTALSYLDTNTHLVLIIPDKWVSFYIAEIPIKESKKQLQAVPYILEDKIISDVSNMHFSIGSAVGNNLYIVAAIAQDKILNLLGEFSNDFRVRPPTILTDAMCLYNSAEQLPNNYKIYLNGLSQSALILSQNIVISDLSNLPLIINQLGKHINVDLFKLHIDDINSCFADSLSKLNINSEQNIDKWLPFLAQTWLNNKKKSKFNLAKLLVKQDYFNIKFAKSWRYVAIMTLLAGVMFYSYKMIDNSVYLARDQEVSNLIKNELVQVGIENSNITLAMKQVDKLIQDYEREIIADLEKDKFYLLLSKFSENVTSEIQLKKIIFEDNHLELTISVAKDSQKLLERIKNNINTDTGNILLHEQSSKNPDEIVWVLSLKEKISLNI